MLASAVAVVVTFGFATAAGVLAAAQYAPQLAHTYHTRLVGALSIPMMLIQTPGGFVMVLSVALRPGTNWTTWIQFLVAALMQAVLLAMCLAWKVRQARLCIDDFGHPLPCAHAPAVVVAEAIDVDEDLAEVDENAPLLAKPHNGWRRWFARK
ncbi:hypothetical protein EWM64_g7592 [Hericium alpestre]|uniref:Uncharacterized protein n=1 Tax=Hericium alpestre TaxID=135208 RepID=A0A4Y9ZQA2_9AGAM|nr:hypothetical protein EWM64_g7592 [Hericium alpestre]